MIDIFKRKCVEITLTDTHDITNNNKTSEEFANKVRIFEKEHKNDKNFGLGNEEHNILISNDHNITFFSRDENGNLLKDNFTNANNIDETNIDNEIKSEETSNIKINEDKEELVKLISEEEFYELINNEHELNEKEKEQINLFNAYLGDLLIYKDYLMPELKSILNRFEKAMNAYALNSDQLSKKQADELKKYYEMLDKKQNFDLNNSPNKINDNIRKLALIKPNESNKAGYTVLTTIISVISVSLAIIITVILTLNFIQK